MRTPELAAALILVAIAVPAAAQYKWVGPTGTVTYSDQPPPPGMSGQAMGLPAPPRSDADGVPAALRGAASKFPVILYTTPDCAPCQQARSHLSTRGIPYSERTVADTADVDAFRKAGFAENSFPAVSVGRERSVGYEAGEWDRLLDAAGYPKKSVLPTTYKQGPARAASAVAGSRATAAANDAGGIVTAEAPPAEGAADAAPVPVRQRGPAPRPESAATAPPPPNRTSLRF